MIYGKRNLIPWTLFSPLFSKALKCFFSILCLATFSLPSWGHGGMPTTSSSEKTFYVILQAGNAEERSFLANMIHMDFISDEEIHAYLNAFDLEQIQKKAPHLLLEVKEIFKTPLQKGNEDIYEYPKQDELYHTYAEMVKELKDLHQAHPSVTEIFSLGKTVEGQDIPGIRLTAQENKEGPFFVPGILFVGGHHAREHLSTEVPLELIKYLLQQYSQNESIKKLIDSRDIYFVPMLNPDGAMHDIKGRSYKLWRKNRRLNEGNSYGVDLNRNYSYRWGTGGSSTSPNSDVYMGPSSFSEPETKAVKDFIESHPNIRIFLSFHTYSELILYPWGNTYEGIGGEDEAIFKKMAETMAGWNRYTPQQSSALYIASGDTCDWAYADHGIFCFTFELSPKNDFFGRGFYPGSAAIEKSFKANLQPALYLMDLADNPHRALRNF